MSKEKIEEMARVIKSSLEGLGSGKFNFAGDEFSIMLAKAIYAAGDRRQIEGEWTRVEVNGKNYGQIYYQHKDCEVNETQLFSNPYNFCPNCGAHMRKEDEGK